MSMYESGEYVWCWNGHDSNLGGEKEERENEEKGRK